MSEASTETKEPVKSGVVQPTEQIEGWVTIESGHRDERRANGKNRQTHYMHGLCLPGLGLGHDRRQGKDVPVARNRFLLPDKNSYDWFKDLMALPRLPDELEGIVVRMYVKSFLGDNIAFVRPTVFSLERAKMEWKARTRKILNESIDSTAVKDDQTLCHAFYTRGFKLNDQPGTIARILPHTFKALVVMNNGYFYELSGADRLQRHVGRAGTNGMILDRDIRIAINHRQLFDRDEVQRMMDDPQGYAPLL